MYSIVHIFAIINYIPDSYMYYKKIIGGGGGGFLK